jgi:hypothetical protein
MTVERTHRVPPNAPLQDNSKVVTAKPFFFPAKLFFFYRPASMAHFSMQMS